MTPTPPGALRVAWLLARVSLRRRWNRLRSLRAMRRQKKLEKKAENKAGNKGATKEAPPRTATPQRGRRAGAGVVIIGLFFLFQGVVLSNQLIGNIVSVVSPETMTGTIAEEEPASTGLEQAPPTRRRVELFPDASLWPEDSAARELLAGSLGLVLFVLLFGLLCSSVGDLRQDVTDTGWDLQWLFTFPVPTQGLLLARLGEYVLLGGGVWLVSGALVYALLVVAGFGWWSIPLAVASAAYANILVASARVVLETWLRKRLTRARLKNVQAGASLIGMTLLFGVLFTISQPIFADTVVSVARYLPGVLLWLPPTLPTKIATDWWALLLLFLLGPGLVLGGTRWAQWLLRDGLVQVGGGAYQAKRRSDPGRRSGTSSRLRGIVGKEIRLLLRDRNLMVRTLFVPVLIAVFNILLNPSLGDGGGGNPTRSATVAFGVGAYVLAVSGFTVLRSERHALWMLYTFPVSLRTLLQRKAGVWVGIGTAYTAVSLALLWRPDLAALPGSLVPGAMAVVGTFVCGYAACGLAALYTEPTADPQQQQSVQTALLSYSFVAAMAGFAIYTDDLSHAAGILVLVIATTYAIWQAADDRLPYLLDASMLPPRRISLVDGLIAVMMFMVLQAVAAFMVTGITMEDPEPTSPSLFMLVGVFAFAGLVTVIGSAFTIPGSFRAILEFDVGRSIGRTLGRHAGIGVACGAVAALAGTAYLRSIEQIEGFLEAKNAYVTGDMSATDVVWFVILGVVLAPLMEEYVFRGLLFKGLRRSAGLAISVVGSAALFAAIHPAVGVAPVFVMGVLAALAMEWTGSLVAPVLTHAVYNAAVFAAEL